MNKKEMKVEIVRNIPCVKELIREIKYLEDHLLNSPWQYKGDLIGESKSIEPTLEAIKKYLNEVLRLLVR